MSQDAVLVARVPVLGCVGGGVIVCRKLKVFGADLIEPSVWLGTRLLPRDPNTP